MSDRIKVNEGGAVSDVYGREVKCIQVWWGNLRERATWKT